MKWRDPKKELPEDCQNVFIMMEPHKWRGSMSASANSIQINAGEYFAQSGRVENMDEYGYGSVSWQLNPNYDEDLVRGESIAIAWLPKEEMPFPDFYVYP